MHNTMLGQSDETIYGRWIWEQQHGEAIMSKSEVDIALEIYQSVQQSTLKQKRLKSSTFWGLFGVKARHQHVVDRVATLLETQGLKVFVKSGETLGQEKDDDWVMLTMRLPQPGTIPPPVSLTQWPAAEWFSMIQGRIFESEREVEAFFVAPLLEQLGYEYDDIVIGYPVEVFKGVHKITIEADCVMFNGPSREKKDALLLIEAKKKGISADHIGQAKSYAQELIPAYYVLTNGQQVKVYQFNGLLAPDDCVMDFERTVLKDKWQELYGYISKESSLKRKKWLSSKLA